MGDAAALRRRKYRHIEDVSTITAIIEPSPDGTLHLPIPADLRSQRILVRAELEVVNQPPTKVTAGLWKELPGPFWIAEDFDAPIADFHEYME